MVRDEPVGPFMRLDSPKGWRVGSDGHDMSCPYNRWASWSPPSPAARMGHPCSPLHVRVQTPVAVPPSLAARMGHPRSPLHVRVQTPVAVPPSLAARMGHPRSLLPRARANPSCSPTLACGEDGA